MPARDALHYVVREALEKDGWTITHDPYLLQYGTRDLFADLGAENLAAERAGEQIAVEVKSFLGQSEMREFELGLGQFVLYRLMMEETDPQRLLLLAFPEDVYRTILGHPDGERLIRELRLAFLTIDPLKAEIVRWQK